MSHGILFSDLPDGITACAATARELDDGRWGAEIQLELGGGGHSLQSNTDVVLVVDASFSMFARTYRNGRIFGLTDSILSFVAPFDADGVDIYLHSLRAEPFRYLGAYETSDRLMDVLADFTEARTASRLMGQNTVLAPVLRDLVRRLKEEKGSEKVFVEIVTDGVFDDEEELEKLIIECGLKYNSPESPYGLRLHFTGVGSDGARGLAFLDRLDNDLEGEVEGWIDCIEAHTADNVEQNTADIIHELKQTVQLSASNATFEFGSAVGAPAHARYGEHGWEDGGFLSVEGNCPVALSFSLVFDEAPDDLQIDFGFIDEDGGDWKDQKLVGRRV